MSGISPPRCARPWPPPGSWEMAGSQTRPPSFRVVDESAWVKLWNSLAHCSGVMPMPVSRTQKCRLTPPLALTHLGNANDDLASPNLAALLPRLINTWPSRRWVADREVGTSGAESKQQLEAFVLGLQAEHAGQVLQHMSRWKSTVSRLIFRLQFGEVQDVVDDAQQDFTQRHTFSCSCAGLVKVGLQHQVAHADDGVHGRANLMVDVGQEIALLRLVLRQRMRLLDFFDGRPLQRNPPPRCI